jgi:DNA-binding NarL/FixJ family response regulator
VRLYLCDDNRSHRVLYREVLADAPDLELIGTGSDPRRAADEVRALRPDVVLMDVSMPGIDGFAALPLFRAAVPEAIIIMFSTAWSAANEERALELGATAYVQKPRDITDLPALIRGAAGDAAALVQHLVERWLAGDVERAIAAVHHEVEVINLLVEPLYGIDALRRAGHGRPPGIKALTVQPVELLEHDGKVALLARAEVVRAGDDGDYTEHLAPAWVMTARHGKLTRIRAYPTWDDARTAAGIDSGTDAVKARRLNASGRWALAKALVRPPRAAPLYGRAW